VSTSSNSFKSYYAKGCVGFTPSLVFNSTINKANKGLLLLVALSTHVSLINMIFSLLFPDLDLRSLGRGSSVKVRLQSMYLNE